MCSASGCAAEVDGAPECVPFDVAPEIFVERAGGTCGPVHDTSIVTKAEPLPRVTGRHCSDTGWIAEGSACVRGRICDYQTDFYTRVQSSARVDDDGGLLTVDANEVGGHSCRSTYDFPIAALRRPFHPPGAVSAE